MDPKVWGRYIWTSIHIVALGYPDNPSNIDKQNYKNFYTNIWTVLPCQTCADNYQRHLQELPIDEHLSDNMSLFKWTVDLHNIVNKELGQRQIPFEEAKERFQRLARGEDPNFASINKNWDRLIMVLTVLAIAITVICVLWFVNRTKQR